MFAISERNVTKLYQNTHCYDLDRLLQRVKRAVSEPTFPELLEQLRIWIVDFKF